MYAFFAGKTSVDACIYLSGVALPVRFFKGLDSIYLPESSLDTCAVRQCGRLQFDARGFLFYPVRGIVSVEPHGHGRMTRMRVLCGDSLKTALMPGYAPEDMRVAGIDGVLPPRLVSNDTISDCRIAI